MARARFIMRTRQGACFWRRCEDRRGDPLLGARTSQSQWKKDFATKQLMKPPHNERKYSPCWRSGASSRRIVTVLAARRHPLRNPSPAADSHDRHSVSVATRYDDSLSCATNGFVAARMRLLRFY